MCDLPFKEERELIFRLHMQRLKMHASFNVPVAPHNGPEHNGPTVEHNASTPSSDTYAEPSAESANHNARGSQEPNQKKPISVRV